MDNDLHFSSGLPVHLIPGLPPGYAGALLPGGVIRSAVGDFGYLVRQEIERRQFSIRHQTLRFFERRQLRSYEEPPGLLVSLALRQTLVQEHGQSARSRLPEKHFKVFYGKTQPTLSTFAPGKEYQWIDLVYAPSLIHELLRAFPKLGRFLQPGREKRKDEALVTSRRATEAMLQIIAEILSASGDGRKEEQAKDFLLMTLEQAQGNAGQAAAMTAGERAAIDRARTLIEADITLHWSTVDLARKVQLNEFTFKILFRQLTGKGTFEYLQQLRLNKAHDLLTSTGWPIKAIHRMVGYDSLTGFITGFKKYFGYTPGSLRR